MYPFFFNNLIGHTEAAEVDTPQPTPRQDPPSTDVQELQNPTTSGQCHTAQLQVIHVGLPNFNTCVFFPNFWRCRRCWGHSGHQQCQCPTWGDKVMYVRNRGNKPHP